jgi:TPR repeat protein
MLRTLLCAAAIFGLAEGGAVARADPYTDGLVLYLNGDYAGSFKLLAPLAEQGNLSATSMVGGMYVGGFGVDKDCGKGEAMVSQAARAGYARAQYAMGRIYGVGACGVTNPAESFSWYQKAAKQRDPDAAFVVGLTYAEGGVVPMDLGEAYCWFRASLKFFDEAYSALPINADAPVFRNKRAAETNVRVLKNTLPRTARHRGEKLLCIA